MTEKEQQRKLLEIHTRQFLKAGGKITVVPPGTSEYKAKTFSDLVWRGLKEEAKELL